MISLGDALAIMNKEDLKGKKSPFSIQFVTCSNTKKEGGEVITLKDHILCGHKMNMNENAMINARPVNDTRHPTAIYIHLITKVNGNKIFY